MKDPMLLQLLALLVKVMLSVNVQTARLQLPVLKIVQQKLSKKKFLLIL